MSLTQLYEASGAADCSCSLLFVTETFKPITYEIVEHTKFMFKFSITLARYELASAIQWDCPQQVYLEESALRTGVNVANRANYCVATGDNE